MNIATYWESFQHKIINISVLLLFSTSAFALPTIIPLSDVSIAVDKTTQNLSIATVTSGTTSVTINSGNTATTNGVTISAIKINGTNVTATATATKVASDASFDLVATDGGATTPAKLTVTVTNTAPTIVATPISIAAGSQAKTMQIATVSDAETPTNIKVTLNGNDKETTKGITISGITIASNGGVSANIETACDANTNEFTLQVSDGVLIKTEKLGVTVNTNSPPELTYSAQNSIGYKEKGTVKPSSGPTDNGKLTTVEIQDRGSYEGAISVTNAGEVTLNNAMPIGTHAITLRATDDCKVFKDTTLTLNVTNQKYNTNDNGAGSFREALTLAPPGSIVSFNPQDNDAGCSEGICTIELTSGSLYIDKDITVQGPGANVLILTRAANAPSFPIISVAPGVTTRIKGMTITKGVAANGGGIVNAGKTTLETMIVMNNTATIAGGGISNTGTLTLSNSIIDNNTAPQGAGIDNSGRITILSSTLENNLAFNNGGGIHSAGGPLLIVGSTLNSNSAMNGAGLMLVNGDGDIVTNSTFSGNKAINTGGGITQQGIGALTLRNDTFSGNAASVRGGSGIYNQGVLLAFNTLIANGTKGECVSTGTFAVNTNNLVEDGSCYPLYRGDPKLGVLKNNGGATKTHQLLSGSVAINNGDNTTCRGNDQRGVARPQAEVCDIGALEVKSIVDSKAEEVNTLQANSDSLQVSVIGKYDATVKPCGELTPKNTYTITMNIKNILNNVHLRKLALRLHQLEYTQEPLGGIEVCNANGGPNGYGARVYVGAGKFTGGTLDSGETVSKRLILNLPRQARTRLLINIYGFLDSNALGNTDRLNRYLIGKAHLVINKEGDIVQQKFDSYPLLNQ